MQEHTPSRPVSSTLFEAIQLLRPHPKIRPLSRGSAETSRSEFSTARTARGGNNAWSESGVARTAEIEEPHLHTSRRQYEVASSRVLGRLGRLDTEKLTSATSSAPSSATASATSPMSAVFQWMRSLPPSVGSSLGGEKKHGAICRTKSVVTRTLRREKRRVASAPGTLHPGFYSASTERLAARDT
jgi:hypothetical protein